MANPQPSLADTEYVGPMRDGDGATDSNALSFFVKQIVNRNATATLVQVQAVTNAGGVSPIGRVDVLPLVNQVDGLGNATVQSTVYGLPYFRLFGGANAVILDPQVGDIGLAVFCSHDVSSVKANGAQSNPGSRRRFSMSDGVYLGGCLNGQPTQYVQFTGTGINIVSPNKVTITAPNVEVDAATQFTVNAPLIALNGAITQAAGTAGGAVSMVGPLTVVNDVTANGTSVHTHVHTGVQSGGSNTGKPA